MKYLINMVVILWIGIFPGLAQVSYPDNEDGQYEDMLTPQYYHALEGDTFRLEVNKFVHYSRLIPFQHPLSDSLGNVASYSLGRGFGEGLGPGGTSSHHPAFDYYLGNSSTFVNMYAVCDGVVNIDRTVSRYRHYLSITAEVKDSTGSELGKVVVFYGHIDLDLDEADGIDLDGQFVKKGDLVSKHLYSGTMGGPHLHFEIRYYRKADSGLEDFYGGQTEDKTIPSAGPWSYGYWNNNSGYGFAHPLNHLNSEVSGIPTIEPVNKLKVYPYPNPTKENINIRFKDAGGIKVFTITNATGRQILQRKYENEEFVKLDISVFSKGIYFLNISGNGQNCIYKIVKE